MSVIAGPALAAWGNGQVPLVARPADAPLFRSPKGDISTAAFLADARRCAAVLPDAAHVVNCCTNRYWFAVGFAAALLRGQVSLLTSDHSVRGLAALAARFNRVCSLGDDPAVISPLPHVEIGPGAAADCPPAPVPGIAADQLAAIVFTSGSTGEPVGTPKTFAELAVRSHAAGIRFGFHEAAPAMIVGTVPPHHMYGFETTILLPLHAAVSSWCHPVFYPADLHAALASPTARSVLVTTPLQLRAMLAMRGAQHFPDTVISATAPLDAELAAEAERVWHSEVLEIFGATEVGSIASRRTVADADWSLYPGVTLSGEDGPLVTAPGAASRRLSDVVTLLDGGQRFRLIGRCGDMVKLGGRRASLAGLTRALTGLEGVSDGVFVAPDDIEIRPTARLMALVVSPALSNEDVLGALRQRIDPVFMPRPLVRVAALPRNALGKLPRQDVLSLLARHAPARPGRATF